MIQYIYFVKCPNCEDEPFDFFDEAKEYALGCLSDKPVITQVEVNRNDFGECVDSSDLGTVWSWEELMSDVPAEDPAVSVFTKDDFAEYDPDCDPEFDDSNGLLDTVPDNFRRPIPDGMSIESIVEEMEENEDTVECKWCEELYDKSECRYEVDLGWLCDRCEAAIKSRGEQLTFREGPLTESKTIMDYSGTVPYTIDLNYDNLEITLYGNQRDADDWDEIEYSDSFTYTLSANDVADTIWENFLTEEDVKEVPGGFDAMTEDPDVWFTFFDKNIDRLVDKYEQQLLDFYEEDATEAFSNSYSYEDYVADNYYNESAHSLKGNSLLETLEESDEDNTQLSLCPECGEDSFDREAGICICCGFSIA